MRRRGVLAGLAGLVGLGTAQPVLAATSRQSAGARRRPRRVRVGIEKLARDRYRLLRGQKVGVITNPTGVLPDLRHEVGQ